MAAVELKLTNKYTTYTSAIPIRDNFFILVKYKIIVIMYNGLANMQRA